MEPKSIAPTVFACPRDIAGKIAASRGGKPKPVSAPPTGSDAVKRLVSQIQAAQKYAHKVKLKLD